jgi:hypothetical protein
MARIPLTRGLTALVDDADAPAVLAAGAWFALPEGRTHYAARNYMREDGQRRVIRLHTFLTGWPRVDHRNGDGLDNRRDNLRPATYPQNNRNARRRSDNTSGYKGVSWRGDRSLWVARIWLGGRKLHLGYFSDPAEAARAYDAAAREHFGAYARPNFPEVTA